MLEAGVERIQWSEEDNEWFSDTWRDALWGYVEKNMDPKDFERFSELVGRKAE